LLENLNKQFEEEKDWSCCEYHKRQHYLISTENWAIRRASEYSDSYLQLGNIKYMQKNFAEAEKYFHRAIDRDKNNLQAWKNLIILYRQTNKTDKLQYTIQLYQKTFPQDQNLSQLGGV